MERHSHSFFLFRTQYINDMQVMVAKCKLCLTEQQTARILRNAFKLTSTAFMVISGKAQWLGRLVMILKALEYKLI